MHFFLTTSISSCWFLFLGLHPYQGVQGDLQGPGGCQDSQGEAGELEGGKNYQVSLSYLIIGNLSNSCCLAWSVATPVTRKQSRSAALSSWGSSTTPSPTLSTWSMLSTVTPLSSGVAWSTPVGATLRLSSGGRNPAFLHLVCFHSFISKQFSGKESSS